MTRPADMPPLVVKNVGVIFYGPALTSGLREQLRRNLMELQRTKPRLRVLHHGGSPEADTAALQIVRDLGGWQDRVHPDELAIIGASRVLVAVGPRPEQNTDASSRAAAWREAIQAARAARVQISYVGEAGQRQKPRGQKQSRKKQLPPGKTPILDAPRLTGRARSEPSKSSRTCRRCKEPVPVSRERWGWLCENCERHPRRIVSSDRVPLGNSVYARSAGLPGLGKRH